MFSVAEKNFGNLFAKGNIQLNRQQSTTSALEDNLNESLSYQMFKNGLNEGDTFSNSHYNAPWKNSTKCEDGGQSTSFEKPTADTPLSPTRSYKSFPILNTNCIGRRSDGAIPQRCSVFWVKCGDFGVSTEVCRIDSWQLLSIYRVFGDKTTETKDVHFGIDNHQFAIETPYEQYLNRDDRSPEYKEVSYYWFSSGNLCVAFVGKAISTEKIIRLFAFIKANTEESGFLRFGVDGVDFSDILYC